MALEHALLVSLRERPASGLDLTRRFERSIGRFWQATHQQIYRVLGRMEADGLVLSHAVEQHGAANKKVYRVTAAGEAFLAGWLSEPAPPDPARSDLAVKMRGASFGERGAVLDVVEQSLREHRERLAHYHALSARDYPDPGVLTGLELDQYLVLRGGILGEESYVAWLVEYLTAHGREND
jgi:DNA-binding PadR family transcriptional regulator